MTSYMIRSGKILLGLGMWLAFAGTGGAFSLLGPFPAWQLAAYGGLQLDYNQQGDIGGPQGRNEGYRWNIPVIYYAFDQTFINYFGPSGIAAVTQAINTFNNLPPMDQIVTDGFSFFVNGEIVPTRTTLVNQTASEIGLLDVKSTAMRLLIEELGLAEPERYAWALGSREVQQVTGAPAITNYSVINLNFDPITLRPTNMVNGVLYSYVIEEFHPVVRPDFAEAVEIPDDLAIFAFQSVAGGRSVLTTIGGSFTFSTGGGQIIVENNAGRLYTGLTHDDIGGLRWLYRANRFAVENLETNVVFGTQLTGRNSPWTPFFGVTNGTGTNLLLNTNLLVSEALRGGINKIRFQRVNYDSLLGRTFTTITNRFMDRFVTNGQVTLQPVQRVINRPDIVFTAERLGLDNNFFPFLTSRTGTGNWQNNDAINGIDVETDGGPGVIQGPVVIRFTDQLPFFLNSTAGGVTPTNTTQVQSVVWGSFNEGSAEPIVYPQPGLDVPRATFQELRQRAAGGGN